MGLPIGYRHGCFTIVGGTERYQDGPNRDRITFAKRMRQKYLSGALKRDALCAELFIDPNTHRGISLSIIESEDSIGKFIDDLESEEGYQIQCKCGKVFYCRVDHPWWLRKRFKYCGEDCGLKVEHEKKILASCKRVKDKSYDLELTDTIHESLKVLECVDDAYEKLSTWGDKRKYGDGTVSVYKLYRCKCYLCGKEHHFKSADFEIINDSHGINAAKGYYCHACCDCHKISSFQWRTVKILEEHHIDYRVEVSFADLIGSKRPLRYDFAIFNQDRTIRCFIECQGLQHYEPVEEFGGALQYEIQVKNDELKREFANNHKIPLIEIPHTCNTYEKELNYLRVHQVI